MNLSVAENRKQFAPQFTAVEKTRPVLILTINNGSGHIRAAEAISEAFRKINREIPVRVIEVSGFMSPLARFTHVTAYLWLVKNLPAVWDKIDRYQKRQTNTSPEWFYRRECRKLFDLAREILPSAIIATEVGCGEIAALIKRDLNLKIPFVAVNVNYDADRAWLQAETDFYCLANEAIKEDFIKLGAKPENIAAWGVPMQSEFAFPDENERKVERRKVNELLDIETESPLVLIAGGGEGMGKIEEIAASLVKSKLSAAIIILAGKNEKLRANCEKLKANLSGKSSSLRVLGWTENVPQLYRAADILISKLGNTFDEATACGLPIIALPPPPGSEWAQYEFLQKANAGIAVKTVREVVAATKDLLSDGEKLKQMRLNSARIGRHNAAQKLAVWLEKRIKM